MQERRNKEMRKYDKKRQQKIINNGKERV